MNEPPYAAVSTLLDASGVWLTIAREHVAGAWSAREDGQAARDNGRGLDASQAMSQEFHEAMVALVASALALEALDLQETAGAVAGLSLPQGANQGALIALRLAHVWGLAAPEAADLRGRLDSLFEDRNLLVHFDAQEQSELMIHPTGPWVAIEIAHFTAERAQEALQATERTIELKP